MGYSEVSIPAPPEGFDLDTPPMSAVPPPPLGFTLDAAPAQEVPPPPEGFTLDSPVGLKPTAEGVVGSAVPAATSVSGAPNRAVTKQPSGFDLALDTLPPGFKLLSKATGLTDTVNTVNDALTSEDTPAQAASKARIRNAGETQPDKSSLAGDLKTSYNSYSKGQLVADYADLQDEINRKDTSHLTGKLAEFAKIAKIDTSGLIAKRSELLAELKRRHLQPKEFENPTYTALNMEENSDAATTLKNTIAALGEDPYGVFRSATAQSGAASVPSILGGVGGALVAGPYGAAVGAGIGSYHSEYGGDVLEGLQKYGADLSNEKSIIETYKKHGEQIKSDSRKKAAVVAFMDAASGGFEGRIAQIPVRGFSRRVAQVAAGTLVSSVGGMAGEAGGQIAVDGGISDYNAIYQEALGEMLPGAITETGQIVGEKIKNFRNSETRLPSEEELKALWNESNPQDLVSTYREAINSGRTLYGFAIEGQPVYLGTYDEAEALAGKGNFRRGKLIAVNPAMAENLPSEYTAETVIAMLTNPTTPTEEWNNFWTSMSPAKEKQIRFMFEQYDYANSPELKAKIAEELQPDLVAALSENSVYRGTLQGLGITPREDNYLMGDELQPRGDGWSMLYHNKGTSKTLDLDALKEQADAKGWIIVPGSPKKRLESTPELIEQMDATFDFTTTDARNIFMTFPEDAHTIRKTLFTSGEVKWKGRLDPRFIAEGMNRSGFQLVDMSGNHVPIDEANDVLEKITKDFIEHPDISRMFDKMNYPHAMEASSDIQAIGRDLASKGVVGFGVHPGMAKMVKYLEELRKLTGMKQKIILVAARRSGNHFSGTDWDAQNLSAYPDFQSDVKRWFAGYSSRNGFFIQQGPDTFVLGITDSADPSSPLMWSETGLLHVLSHEFGHALVASKLIAAPLSTILSVYSAFRRHRAAFDATTRYHAENQGLTPGSWEARQKSPFRQQGGSPYSYGATMEEWAAEQVARWAFSKAKPMGIVSKLFRDVAKKMLLVIRKLQLSGIDIQAEPEIEDWIRSLKEKEIVVDYADEIEKMANVASTYENSKVDNDPTPMHENSVPIYQALDEWGPKAGPLQSQQTKSAIHNAKVVKAVVDKYNWFYKWAANLRQLSEANPHIKELQIARELFAFAKIEASKIMVGADTTLQAWRKLGETQGRALSAFLFDLNEMNYLSDTERQTGVRRWPDQQEFITLVQSHGLTQESIVVYRQVRDFFLETIKRMEELKIVDAQKITDPRLQLEAIAAAKKDSANLISKPYFPHMRFGKYAVTVKSRASGKLDHIALFETVREAKVAAYQAMKHWPDTDWLVVQDELREDVQQYVGMSSWMLDKIRNMPNLTKEQLFWIDQLRYQNAPSQSFTKHMMKRKNYTGFSTDGQRTFASYAFHHARNYPRVKFADAFRDTIKSLDQSLPPGYTAAERAKRKPMADLVQHQVNEFMSPSQDWAQLRAMNAIWHLGFNAKSAVVNMTQVFFSAAFLGTKFGGVGRAEAAILAAGAKLNTFYKKGKYENTTDSEFRAIDRAMKDGHIDESMAAELAALAVGGGMGQRIGKSFVGDKFLHSYISFTEKAMWMFRMTEQWQRRVIFRATWQLAITNPSNAWVQSLAQKHPLQHEAMLKEGWTDREALAYLAGMDALQSTIGIYDHDSRPRYMQGRKSVMFAFQAFTQQMLWTLWNNKDMWGRYMLYYAVIGGSMGIVPDDFKGLFTYLGRMLFGNQFNLERNVREFIVEMLGKDSKISPDLILHGTARYGFGIPHIMQTLGAKFVPDVDLSPSITLNKLLPVDIGKLPIASFKGGFHIENAPGAQQFNDILAGQVEAASGAAYGIPIAMWKALSSTDMDMGDFKRWEGMVPSAARNVSKAFRYGFGQGERDKNFATTVGFDGEDPEQLGEILAVALGFRPTRIAQIYDKKAAGKEINEFWTIRKQLLLRQAYRDKFVYKDKDAFKETMTQITKYNKEVHDKKYAITREGFIASMKNRAEAVAKTEQGAALPPGLRSAMDKMFPEVAQQRKVK